MSEKFKNCPFCNSQDVAIMREGKSDQNAAYRVVCRACKTRGPKFRVQPWHDSKFVAQGQAAKAWNQQSRQGNSRAVESERDTPLTLEELREMAQRCEGIYVANVNGSPVFRNQTYCAAVLDISPAFGSAVMHVHAIYGDRLTMWEDEYGRTWLAYRQKPEDAKRRVCHETKGDFV